MADPVRKTATYADLEAVPPNMVAEIIDGSLVTHPRPAPAHSVASSSLTGEISDPFQKGGSGPGGWIFVDEPELHLGIQVLVPDIAGWRRQNLTELPQTPYFETAPDWVCEVISPSTERYDRGAKRRIYANAGVASLWLLNPISRVLEAFERDGEEWRTIATIVEGEDVSVRPFDAITFPIDNLWPLPIAGQGDQS